MPAPFSGHAGGSQRREIEDHRHDRHALARRALAGRGEHAERQVLDREIRVPVRA